MDKKGSLILIPVSLGHMSDTGHLSDQSKVMIMGIRSFFVENEKTARAFLHYAGFPINTEVVDLWEVSEHTRGVNHSDWIFQINKGHDVGLLSEAGMPCVADPGAEIVAAAHANGIKVKVLTGPSSIFLALTASGFNGQQFTFHGYFPIKEQIQREFVMKAESECKRTNYTQIFMETPYRADKTFEYLISVCKGETLLCVASELTTGDELIETKTINQWKNKKPDLKKKRVIFLLQSQ